MARNNALLVGISGVSSSGKSTLSRLLRDIFPNTFILHEDDFYKTDTEIPINHDAGDVADWVSLTRRHIGLRCDCLESINLPALEEALKHIKLKGMPPADLVSKEDKNDVGKVDVDAKVIEDLKWKAGRWMFHDVPPVAIIDGFLLFSEDMKSIREQFDVKLFLRTDFATAKSRREARNGYVTIEGFWEDPPMYVDKVVWPNYVKDHSFLFQDGNVEGEFKQDVVQQLDLETQPPGSQGDMTALLHWAYDVVNAALESNSRQ